MLGKTKQTTITTKQPKLVQLEDLPKKVNLHKTNFTEFGLVWLVYLFYGYFHILVCTAFNLWIPESQKQAQELQQ